MDTHVEGNNFTGAQAKDANARIESTPFLVLRHALDKSAAGKATKASMQDMFRRYDEDEVAVIPRLSISR